jgi:hypothetical protein
MNKATTATVTASTVGALYPAATEMQLAAAADWIQRFAERWANPAPERFFAISCTRIPKTSTRR